MKNFRKLIAVCLVLLTVFSLSSSALATEESEKDMPLIYIPGFTSSNVYDDISNPDTLVGYPTSEDILSIVTEAFIPALIVFSADKNTDKLVTTVTDRVNDAFAYWFNEPTGEAKEGSGFFIKALVGENEYKAFISSFIDILCNAGVFGLF